MQWRVKVIEHPKRPYADAKSDHLYKPKYVLILHLFGSKTHTKYTPPRAPSSTTLDVENVSPPPFSHQIGRCVVWERGSILESWWFDTTGLTPAPTAYIQGMGTKHCVMNSAFVVLVELVLRVCMFLELAGSTLLTTSPV